MASTIRCDIVSAEAEIFHVISISAITVGSGNDAAYSS